MMKKIFLLLMVVLSAFSFGVYAQVSAGNSSGKMMPVRTSGNSAAAHSRQHHGGRITSAPACSSTETFGTGSYSVLPTGWTAGIFTIAGTTPATGTWHWADTAPTSLYSAHMGTLRSTSASNGWMIYDSDSLGDDGVLTGPTPAGWLQSPPYNCSAIPSVYLKFQEYYEKFQDSCFLWVTNVYPATWAAGTYSVYPIVPNDTFSTGSGATTNPDTVWMDISAVAASNAHVSVRFVYYGPAGGGYAWMLDDLCLGEVDSVDVGIGSSSLLEPMAVYSVYGFGNYSSVFSTPLIFTDTIYPAIQLINYGIFSENVPVTAQIWEGGTSVYYDSIDYAITAAPSDSGVVFPGYYVPTSIGSYSCAFSAPLAGDRDTSDNYGSAAFNITDTLWMQNQGNMVSRYYVYEADSAPRSTYIGTRFDVPTSSVGDTVTGFGVAFDSLSVPTNPGALVSVQLYSNTSTGTSWTFVAASVRRPVVAADISTGTTTVWADFRCDTSCITGYCGWSSFVLQPGTTYAAIIQTDNVTTNLTIGATAAANCTQFAGYFGQTDTSDNNGIPGFGSTDETGLPGNIPMVRLYTGSTGGTLTNGISGNVYFGSTPYTGDVKVWLITYDTATLILKAIDSVTEYCSGAPSVYYQFDGVPTDSFRIKAANSGDSAYSYTGYIPTYHTSSFYWDTANVLYHVAGTADVNQNINMAYGSVASGPGFIGGNVTMGANKGTSTAIPVPGLLIVAINPVTGSIIQQTYTDALGNYSFSTLPLGNYEIYPEALNYTTTPYTGISLTATSDSMKIADFIQHTISLAITPVGAGVNNLSSPGPSTITTYPNPTTGNITIQWKENITEKGTVTISDITGRVLQKTSLNMTKGSGSAQADLSDYANGVYMISVRTATINYITKVEVAH